MIKRKILNDLIEWKNRKNKKSLIVSGARQVGKTFIIERFGSLYYEETVEINFKETPSAKDIFSGDLDVETLIMSLKFRFPNKKINPGKTLLFFDEIQECSEAVTALKFLTADKRFDVVVSGSLLGIDYNRASSYPVGYVDHLHMYALDFEEFLWAMGISEDMIHSLREMFFERKVVPETINKRMMSFFRSYLAIGGMPEAVWQYVNTGDYREVDHIQRNLLQGYQYDIAHYAAAEEKIKAERCFFSLTRQLLDKENHKFQYKEIESGARAQKYYSSIEWLLRADITAMCRIVTDIRYDLDDYARDDFFRLYTTDLSLLIAMRDFSLKQHIVENTLAGNIKGGLYECAIADILYKKGYKLYFYKNESAKKEIDFLIQTDTEVIPIEVKSSNSRATSLNGILRKYPHIQTAYKLIDGNIGIGENGVITIPLYMSMFF